LEDDKVLLHDELAVKKREIASQKLEHSSLTAQNKVETFFLLLFSVFVHVLNVF
jgi:hypothetical protein